MKLVKLWYHDHHTDELGPAEIRTKVPSCLCFHIGEIVYENNEWIRLEHGAQDVDGADETHSTISLRKCDIIKRE